MLTGCNGHVDAGGKNDGKVNGKRYFKCADQHGLFVKPSSLTHELGVDGVSAPLAIAAFQKKIEVCLSYSAPVSARSLLPAGHRS